MFAIEDRNRVIVMHRPPGRLMRPSDRMIQTHGLGELDGFLDTLKNFGFGAVKTLTGGIYDPGKNRFYVPFSSGNVRNFASGVTNVTTLGLVDTNKFFNTQTAKTIGTVVGSTAAAATAAVVGRALYTTYGGGSVAPTQAIQSATGTAVKTATGTAVKTATETVAKASTSSLFNLDNVSKVLDIGAKVINAGGQVMASSMPQPQQGMMVDPGYGMYPSALPGSLPIDMTTGQYLPAMYNPMSGGGYAGGSMMVPGGGGGGGFGPPGSEYYVDENGVQVPVANDGGLPVWLLVGGSVILAYVLLSPKKGSKK